MVISKLGYVAGLLAALTVGVQAHGQEDSMENEESTEKVEKAERITVVGSRIKKLDVKGPQPIITIDADQLRKTGATTVNEALNSLTVASFGSGNYGSGYGVGEGVQSISIHGLGSSNTLVLVNGKRLSRDPYLEIIDMSVIPVAAVDKIEILKGTASAVYGSDALGGVVNIMTKKDFDGFNYGLARYQTKFEGGEEDRLHVMSGTSTDNSRNLTVIQYSHVNPILYNNRPWINRDSRSSYGAVPSYLANDGESSVFKTAGECGPEGSITSGGSEFCQWNHMPYLELTGERDNLSLMNDYTYDISGSTSVNVRLFANRTQARSEGSPAVLTPGDNYVMSEAALVESGATLSLAPVVNSDGTVLIRGRLADGGNSYTEVSAMTLSAQASLNHEFNNGSGVEVSVSDSRINRATLWNNRYNESALRAALASGEYNLFAPEGQRGSLENYKLDAPMGNTSYSRAAELVYSGDTDLFSYAVGSTYLVEGYENTVAREVAAEAVKDLGGGSGNGNRINSAVFAELSIPLDSVEIELAARMDNYSDFGSTANPQMGISWRPNNSTLLSANYGTGFKAPTLRDVNDDEARYYTSVFDYKKCNEAKASGSEDDKKRFCEGNQSAEIRSGGNSELDPESSTSWGLTAGYEPLAGTGLQLEYWNTIIEDQITSPSGDTISQMEAEGKTLPAGVAIIRDSTTGEIQELILPVTNLSSSRTSGIDARGYWGSNFDFGRLGFETSYSYYLSYKTQQLEGAEFEELIETSGLPRWRWNNTFKYGFGSHDFNIKSLSVAGYEKNSASEGDVGSYTQWDANWSYTDTGSKSRIEIGGRNIFNQGYPLDETAGIARGIGGSLYSMTGPTVYASFTQSL